MATNDDDSMPDPSAGAIERRDFGGSQIQRDSIATQALVAQARAAVEARYTMAMHRPRNLDTVRVKLMKECRRPGFAAVARYHKPVGDGVEGPSIRFAEAAARCMGNIYTEEYVVYEDEDRIVMRVSATDLEANLTFPKDVRISKTIERRQAKKGDRVVGQRTNSRGQTVYLIATQSEDDLANKVGALCSKALRVCLLRCIPGDLVDEGQALCVSIARDEAAKDPNAARKGVCDAFAEQGVMPDQLARWLGHELETTSPAEIVELRKAFAALRDGEASWSGILEHRLQVLADRKPQPAGPPPGVPSTPGPAAVSPESPRATPAAETSQGQTPAPAVVAPQPAQDAAPARAAGKGTAAAKDALRKTSPQDELPAWAGGVDPDAK